MEWQDNFFIYIQIDPLFYQDVPYYFKITTDFAISEKIGSDL